MIERSVVLACPPERAFALFTEQASHWSWIVNRLEIAARSRTRCAAQRRPAVSRTQAPRGSATMYELW